VPGAQQNRHAAGLAFRAFSPVPAEIGAPPAGIVIALSLRSQRVASPGSGRPGYWRFVMKIPLRSAFVVALFTLVGASAAHAQMTDPMKFTTTFSFSAGKVNFAPGTYVARPLDGDPSVVCIQNEHGGKTAMVSGVGDRPRHEPAMSEVTFVREGSRLVLKSLWDGSDSEGLNVLPSVKPVNAN
jgi:hypothetical protein